jgi:hypothetical protein
MTLADGGRAQVYLKVNISKDSSNFITLKEGLTEFLILSTASLSIGDLL